MRQKDLWLYGADIVVHERGSTYAKYSISYAVSDWIKLLRDVGSPGIGEL
jgi:hypothetical protein